MALSFKHFSSLLLLFILILFSISLQIHARESQFFSKVTNPNNVKEESQLPNKQEPENKELKEQEQEQEPTFVPDTQQGYGLYGHESGQFPPSTTGNNIPYTEYSNNNNNYYYNKNSYNANQQEMKNTVLYDRGYSTMSNQNNNYYNGDNKYSSNNNNGYTNKQQGMSDTRFLENGKYFYDLNSENNYQNEYVNTRNQYNNRGYYGNNNNNNYNNENSYESDNSMEGYQNQEEYQESQDEFVP